MLNYKFKIMCFLIHPKHQKVKIAEKDITCYKILRKIESSPFDNNYLYISPCQHELYFKVDGKEVIKEVEEFGKPALFPEINEGLHSYSSKKKAKDDCNFNKDYKIFRSIIPKGTPYYYNPTEEEYVSLKLKVFNEIL